MIRLSRFIPMTWILFALGAAWAGDSPLPAVAHAEPPVLNPCDQLTRVGKTAFIYNNSDIAWEVVFTTQAHFNGLRSTNAGAVKFLSEGVWQDNGIGDYRFSKSYAIHVAPRKTVPITYCAAGDVVKGKVDIYPQDARYTGGIPDSGVAFFAADQYYPQFRVFTTTRFVDYNRNDKTEIELGSLTLCPHDRQCREP